MSSPIMLQPSLFFKRCYAHADFAHNGSPNGHVCKVFSGAQLSMNQNGQLWLCTFHDFMHRRSMHHLWQRSVKIRNRIIMRILSTGVITICCPTTAINLQLSPFTGISPFFSHLQLDQISSCTLFHSSVSVNSAYKQIQHFWMGYIFPFFVKQSMFIQLKESHLPS